MQNESKLKVDLQRKSPRITKKRKVSVSCTKASRIRPDTNISVNLSAC